MMKKMALLAAGMLLAAAGTASAYEAQLKPFADLAAKDWSEDAVYSLSALGVIEGYEDLTYRPNDSLSREAFVKLLVNAARPDGGSVQGEAGARVTDVPAERWSYPYITAALNKQWIDFMPDASGALRPELAVKREEVAAAIGKYLLSLETSDVAKRWTEGEWTKEKELRRFSDHGAIGQSLAPYVYFAVRQGIMEGDANGFRPASSLTRKEAAATIYRLLNAGLGQRKLEVTGFYAIRSYSAIQRMPLLDRVAFGWSRLSYEGAGSAKLDTKSTEYRFPDGWQEPVDAATQAKLGKELMIFATEPRDRVKDFLRDTAARKSFVESLKSVLSESGEAFTGLCLDLEGLKEADAAADYVAFLREVKAGLGSKTLTVAVPPTYYYKGYDLRGIGEVADTVILMAYDFTHQDSGLPSAPLPLVSDTVKQALLSIPKEKLVLGISKQANQWVTTGGKVTLAQPDIAEVEKRIASPGIALNRTYPYFLKQIAFQDDRGRHTIYYEDADSIAKKLWLAKYYGLKGVSLWHMGNVTAADWETIAKR
ncbi:glycosyl hydrolase family 18 protein [Paenibacillus oleatilyticus]|uniref:Glycosyl hydrolase family 18 protein n=1 Tax=Paenibacillus oleatilyticus TaxID=2594886 RepID=A0ABV4UWF3_9BACL